MKRRALKIEQMRNQGFCVKPFHSGEYRKQKFGFIKRVDKGEITTVKDLES